MFLYKNTSLQNDSCPLPSIAQKLKLFKAIQIPIQEQYKLLKNCPSTFNIDQ